MFQDILRTGSRTLSLVGWERGAAGGGYALELVPMPWEATGSWRGPFLPLRTGLEFVVLYDGERGGGKGRRW
jgi:hypothetical protein